MANKLKMFRNTNQTQRFRFVVLVIGCLVVSMTFIMISKPLAFPSFGSKFRRSGPSDAEGEKPAPSLRDDDQSSKESEKYQEENDLQGKKVDSVTDPIKDEKPETDEAFESTSETEEEGTKNGGNSDQDEAHSRMTLPTISNYTINDLAQVENKTSTLEQPAQEIRTNVEKKLSCEFSDPRADVCEMSGDIRIPGNSSDVLFVDSSERNEEFRFRPYARKGDASAFSRVRELTVKAAGTTAPQCTVTHAVPAVVFSAGGYTGNLFHDFTDVLIPLFLASRHVHGEVQFVVSDLNPWWVYRYLPVFEKLSKFPVIDFDKDKEVHCFSKAVVGLRAHKELSIDPARAPNGYSMVDFAKFLREAFSLERDSISNIEDLAGKKPRILIIARKQSRAFTNPHEIAQLADQLGFEVTVNDGDVGSDVGQFARLVNSMDVMVGVHGSGLTNLLFLPPNATVIQVVPWGGLEWMAMLDFGDPAKDMKLNYVQYSIGIEESSLIDQYPRDHPVFKDPMSIHKQGYPLMRSTFMDNQNVKIDIKKFKNVLWKALEHIIQ
ncbi:alpha-1,3-arabinosyltransferase XAT3-like [Curcuma longa]|uniref:alpha-1,3-arabinosyltransferase XAT3-like n=1 Tax=Curcuma longa TaxID=136217 RepID=UPI003D9F5094